MAEALAYYRVAQALELALAAGKFTPGGRGWKAAQERFIHQQLLRARDDADGRCLLDEVLAERIDRARRRAAGQDKGSAPRTVDSDGHLSGDCFTRTIWRPARTAVGIAGTERMRHLRHAHAR